jgi:hypothetical protein
VVVQGLSAASIGDLHLKITDGRFALGERLEERETNSRGRPDTLNDRKKPR